MERKRVTIERAKVEAKDDPVAIFTEWTSEADEKAFGSLQERGKTFPL